MNSSLRTGSVWFLNESFRICELNQMIHLKDPIQSDRFIHKSDISNSLMNMKTWYLVNNNMQYSAHSSSNYLWLIL